MVLNDGETYMPLEGSMIVAVPDYMSDDAVEEHLKLDDLETIMKFIEA